eukprot:TRINITY_DN22799_c0_g1_i1.p1 TRINITY_DN22799_c0_g1~~TRINITY_DN22799_c0_g1_i1.p1  ORF type:complete len:414 (-),score=88.34 TRINITY_DN22799_c0_g1_i1:74-1315(-)
MTKGADVFYNPFSLSFGNCVDYKLDMAEPSAEDLPPVAPHASEPEAPAAERPPDDVNNMPRSGESEDITSGQASAATAAAGASSEVPPPHEPPPLSPALPAAAPASMAPAGSDTAADDSPWSQTQPPPPSAHAEAANSAGDAAGDATSENEEAQAADGKKAQSVDKFMRTKMCAFSQFGICARGAACKFAHSTDDLNPRSFYRTRMCKTTLAGEVCTKATCSYAHSPEELRTQTGGYGGGASGSTSTPKQQWQQQQQDRSQNGAQNGDDLVEAAQQQLRAVQRQLNDQFGHSNVMQMQGANVSSADPVLGRLIRSFGVLDPQERMDTLHAMFEAIPDELRVRLSIDLMEKLQEAHRLRASQQQQPRYDDGAEEAHRMRAAQQARYDDGWRSQSDPSGEPPHWADQLPPGTHVQ